MERVTRAEAARMLGVNWSTITRWTEKHPALLDDDGLVDPAELRWHRNAVVDPRLQARGPKAAFNASSLGNSVFGSGDRFPQHIEEASVLASLERIQDLKRTLAIAKFDSEVAAEIVGTFQIMVDESLELAEAHAEKLAGSRDPRVTKRALLDIMQLVIATGAGALNFGLGPEGADPLDAVRKEQT